MGSLALDISVQRSKLTSVSSFGEVSVVVVSADLSVVGSSAVSAGVISTSLSSECRDKDDMNYPGQARECVSTMT